MAQVEAESDGSNWKTLPPRSRRSRVDLHASETPFQGLPQTDQVIESDHIAAFQGTDREKLDLYTKEKERLQQSLDRATEGEKWTLELKLKRVERERMHCQQGMKESEKAFKEALANKDGHVKFAMRNALMQGMTGVGKTASKDILFGLPPPEIRTSTGFADAPVRVRNVSGVKVQARESGWKPVEMKDFEQIVADVISSVADSPKIPASSGATNVTTPEIAETSVQLAIAEVHGNLVDLVAKKSLTRDTAAIGRAIKEIFGSNWIYFIDSRGQPHFHNLMPHFVQGISASLFVLRLSERLDDHPMVEYYEDGQSIATPFRSPVTTEDTLKCLVRSMQSHTIDGEKPKLIFIGTFLDKISESSETLKEKNERLLNLLTPEFSDQLVFCNEATNELIFPIDAKNPGAHEEKLAEKIRFAVETSPSRNFDVPISWYALEIILENLSKRLNRKVLSKQECLAVAYQLNLTEDALTEALKFFHEQHILHYFPQILPDVIFFSPQVLLDKLTELVKFAYQMREDSSPFTTDEIRDKGLIELGVLKKFPKHYVKALFSHSDLLKIFTSLLIIIPFSTTPLETIDFTSGNAKFFMPSLLDVLPQPKVEKNRVSSSLASPLLIRFPNGCLRSGVFCYLQVYLIQRLRWKLVCNRDKPDLITQNCVKLSPPDCACVVTLIDSFSYLEVHVSACRCRENLQRACPLVRDDVLHGIKASCRTLRYTSESPLLAFFCPCNQALPRYHAAEPLRADSSLKCTIMEAQFSKLDMSQTIWFLETGKMVTQSTLLNVLDDVGDPSTFGAKLGIKQSKLHQFEKKFSHPHDVTGHKRELFGYIENNAKTLQITWDRIADVVKDMDYGDLSLRIRETYCRGAQGDS